MKIDRTDRQLIHALRVDARATYADLSDALGVSGQTIARRYRRLREAGVIRVVVAPGAAAPGQGWLIRLRVAPGSAERVSAAIAARPDASWVGIVAGGSEILWASRPVTAQLSEALLLQRLPATRAVTGVDAHMVLRVFDDHSEQPWSLADPLSGGQRARLADAREGAAPAPAPAAEPHDSALIECLERDARSSYAELGAAAGISAARARRRLVALRAGDALRVELEVAIGQLGGFLRAWIWMRVAPAALDAVGSTVSQHVETAYVAAVTGAANLVAVVVVPDSDTLYHYLTDRLGALPGIRDLETAPVLRQVKHEGSVPHAGRLPRPGELPVARNGPVTAPAE